MFKKISDKISRYKNKKLIKKYPFIRVAGVADEFTMLDWLPRGWKRAFGKRLCEEIRKELVTHNKLDTYVLLQVKEKFGQLRWYGLGGTERIERQIIPRYERLSMHTCVNCGKRATKVSINWCLPLCDHCAKKVSGNFSVLEEPKPSKGRRWEVVYDEYEGN